MKQKKKKLKKGPIILLLIILIVFCVLMWYNTSLSPVEKNNDSKIVFNIKSGTSANQVMENLENAGIIKNSLSGLIYYRTHLSYSIKAGAYELTKGMSTKDIIKTFNEGKTIADLKLVFVEGKRLTHYASLISGSFGYTYEDVMGVLNDKEFINELIEKYWFLTDEILDDEIFYPLEGYLFPDTYQFAWDVSVETIVHTMLQNFGKKIEMYRDTITNGKYTFHQILSMAAITELEAVEETHRRKVQGVINNRLKAGWSLGMDVTTYYAVQKEMGVVLTKEDFDTVSAYNTRRSDMAGKLPVGPICNPGMMSIEAYFEPLDNNYYYFYANVKTGAVYFAKNNTEFEQIQKDVASGKK